MSLHLASTTLARWLWSLLPVLVHYSMWCEPCVRYETVLDVCSTVLGASTRRSPASCLRIHGARGRLFAVGSTCCLSARPAAPSSCWPLAYRVRAPDLLESAAKVGMSSLVERWKPLYLWLSSLAPNFLWRRKEVTDLERGRGHPGTSLEEL